jgi:3',5'-cyclic AMP phosphodiesterase CpdA
MRTHYLRDAHRNANYITIAIITDIHLYPAVDGDPEAEGASLNSWFYYAGSAKLRRFRDYVNSNDEIDFALCLGDITDRYFDGFALFRSIWDGITKPKALTIGNHDLYLTDYSNVVTALGYDSMTENGGSKFNQKYHISGKNFDVGIITLDTNLSASGFVASNTGWLVSDARDWITTQCNNATEKVILLASHHSPQLHFEATPDGWNAYAELMNNIMINNPKKAFANITGHEHRFACPKCITRNGSRIQNYMCPAALDYLPGRLSVLRIYYDGYIDHNTIGANYPYD